MTFLGVQFSFADFPSDAAGGLKCFIFLAERADAWCGHDEIIGGTDLEGARDMDVRTAIFGAPVLTDCKRWMQGLLARSSLQYRFAPKGTE
jgi:hypothetical protein